MERKRLTPEQIAKIKKLYIQGMKATEIARSLELKKRTVMNYTYKYKTMGYGEQSVKRVGAFTPGLKNLTENIEKLAIRRVQHDKLMQQINVGTELEISNNTVIVTQITDSCIHVVDKHKAYKRQGIDKNSIFAELVKIKIVA